MEKAYEVITNRIMNLLEEGTVPWHRPWGGPEWHPKNLVSGKGYRGINVFMLSTAGYETPYWLSFKQAKDRGGSVRKAEKGCPCIFNVYQQGIEDGEIKNYSDLGKMMGLSERSISRIIDAKVSRKRIGAAPIVSTRILSDTQNLEDKDRKKIFDKVEKGEIESQKVREITRAIRKAPEKVKEALLDDKITVKQAEDLTKIKSDKAREKVLEEVKQHKNLADIKPKLAEKAKPELTDASKKKFNSLQKTIFEHLNEAKVGIIKSNKSLSTANRMLDSLMQREFEYGLQDKTLKLSLQQLQSITDKLSEFNINIERFNETKEIFVNRIEGKNDETRLELR